jgi:hypothetical protein
MRGSCLTRLLMVILVLLGAMASGTAAAEPVCKCFDGDFAGRVIGGFDSGSVSLKLVGAIGLPEYSLATWMDIDALPTPASTFGGEASLTRDWLSIALRAQQIESSIDLSFQAQATPSSWLLVDGKPTLIGGVTALVEADLLRSVGRSEITVSPFFTVVIPAGDTTVSPSIGIDMSLDSETQLLAISGSRLAATVNAGCILIASTVNFTGLYEAFSSLVVSMTVPDWRLSVSGTLIPTPVGGFSYRISLGYECGDTYLLPNTSDKAESVCTGGVCF